MPEQPTPAPGTAVTTYFQPPQGYFWRWAEGNEVVEWLNGTTITYREELAALLTSLAPTGLPPLGAVLLLLSACNSNWQNSSAEIGLLQGLLRGLPPGGPPDEELTFHVSAARSFLDIVRELPTELRQGVAKEHLLREVLTANGVSGLPASPATKSLVARLASYREDKELLTTQVAVGELFSFETEALAALLASGPPATRAQFKKDLDFAKALAQFPTVHSLELRLRTGLDQLPEPLAEVPTPPPLPEPAPDLLAELAQDPQTAGLARLVPHLRAALHLPHTTPQASEQPLGGVADLSNRGPLDRLLLSELAQDDLSLLARLAHGEALYLRREAPPLPQPPPRVLLLDITLLMWGMPRVAGLAAALALAAPSTSNAELPQAFALWGHHAQLLDLRSRAGVVAALSLLDPALHCGAALAAVLPMLPAMAEALLITEAQAAQQPEFLAALASAPATLRFLLTVARSGELVLYELRGGRRTVLSTSQVELSTLLAPAVRKVAKGPKSVQRPAFLRQPVAPLLFPAMRAGLQLATLRSHEELGLVAVTNDQRLLYWADPKRGAQELVPVLEQGSFYLGFDEEQPESFHLFVEQRPPNQAPQLLFYDINLADQRARRIDLSANPALAAGWAHLRYTNDGFLALETSDLTKLFNCYDHQFYSVDYPLPPVKQFEIPADFLQYSYTVLTTLPQIGFYRNQLVVGNYRLVPESEGILRLQPLLPNTQLSNERSKAQQGENQQFIPNKLVDFQKFTWRDGSEALVDSRGLLHLRSTNKNLPEVTLVLVADWPTAAWAADGKRCGSSHFTGIEPQDDDQALTVADFYKAYIEPFFYRIR